MSYLIGCLLPELDVSNITHMLKYLAAVLVSARHGAWLAYT